LWVEGCGLRIEQSLEIKGKFGTGGLQDKELILKGTNE
jgi:hypothetical protein